VNRGEDDKASVRVAGACFALAVALGLLFAAATPPFRVPDEVGHFWRACALASGALTPEITPAGATSELPRGLRKIVQEFWRDAATQPEDFNRYTYYIGWKTPLDRGSRVAVTYPGQYLPTLYVPQVLAAALGNVTNARPLITIYIGRVASVLLFALAVAIAIRISPVAPLGLAIAGLLPMTLYLAASWSADTINNGLAFLFAALLFRTISCHDAITRHEIIVLAAVGALLGTGKPPYCVMLLLLFAVPRERFASMRQRLAVIACVASAVILCVAGSWIYAQRSSATLRSDVDGAQQMRHLTSSPDVLPRLIANDLAVHGSDYVNQSIGRLGMLDLHLPSWLIWLEIGALLLAAQSSRVRVTLQARVLAGVAFLLALVGIQVALYLGWTPPGAAIVEGVQGRYFIALLPLLLLIVSGTWLSPRRARTQWLLGAVPLLGTAVSLYLILYRYFPGSFVH
jgi:hypothetical protein